MMHAWVCAWMALIAIFRLTLGRQQLLNFLRLMLCSPLFLISTSYAVMADAEFLERDAAFLERTPVDAAQHMRLRKLLAEISKQEVVRNRYVQQKSLKVLRRPLISSGVMLYSKDNGVYWRTESPLHSELIITTDSVIQRVDDVETIIQSSQHPLAFQLPKLLFSVFNGDRSELEKNFEFQFVEIGSVWQLALYPRSAEFRKVIDSVTLFGAERPSGVDIVQVDLIDGVGEITRIAFTADSVNAASELTDVERQFFQ